MLRKTVKRLSEPGIEQNHWGHGINLGPYESQLGGDLSAGCWGGF